MLCPAGQKRSVVNRGDALSEHCSRVPTPPYPHALPPLTHAGDRLAASDCTSTTRATGHPRIDDPPGQVARQHAYAHARIAAHHQGPALSGPARLDQPVHRIPFARPIHRPRREKSSIIDPALHRVPVAWLARKRSHGPPGWFRSGQITPRPTATSTDGATRYRYRSRPRQKPAEIMTSTPPERTCARMRTARRARHRISRPALAPPRWLSLDTASGWHGRRRRASPQPRPASWRGNAPREPGVGKDRGLGSAHALRDHRP